MNDRMFESWRRMSAVLALAACSVCAASGFGLGKVSAATADASHASLANANPEASHDTPGHDVPGHDVPGHDAPGHDTPNRDAPDHDTATHIGHADGGLNLENPLEVKTDMAVATFFVFVGLLLVLWKFAWGPISEGLEKREAGIAASIRGAEDANLAAQAVLKEHENRLADTANQVRAMLDEARRDAEQTKLEIVAEAKTSAEAERSRALREIDTAASQALKSLAEKSANLAVELAGKIVESKLSPKEHTRLIEEAMSRFPGLQGPGGQPNQN